MLIVNEEFNLFQWRCGLHPETASGNSVFEKCSINSGTKQCSPGACKRLSKPGKWIYHGYIGRDPCFECSKCETDSNLDYKFCPECGSPMEV